MANWLATLDRRAQLRARAGLTRRLRPRGAADGAVDLAGNDYLGLSHHPDVTAAAARALTEYGLGATGSRLVRGSTDLHDALEAELAAWLGAVRSLVFSSGYLANLAAVRALVRPRTLLVSDAHNHASLIDGCRLSGAETLVTPHLDVAAVDAALAAARGRPAVVVTESVFSVDGDLAPLAELHAVAREYGALLLVDEAHALGVTGPGGAGSVAAAGLAGEPDVVVTATLSKALGGAGGLVAGPAELIQHLVDTGRTFIFDTALPPSVAAGVLAATRLARAREPLHTADRLRAGEPLRAGDQSRAGDQLRAESARRVDHAVRRLRVAGLTVSTPAGAVLSVAAPDAESAVAWAASCLDRGVAVGCFRPPSTPDSRSRLRLTINVGVPSADFDRALDVIVATAPTAARTAPEETG
ncbi:8-amino-7-oxononanoate synthase [Micromonospora sp. NPDC003197]